MKKINRIKYDGFPKNYILQRLKTALKNEDTNLEINIIEKDFTTFLSLDINDFLTTIYHECLEREPDNESFANYLRFMCQGMPREAVIYLIAVSKEFVSKFKIKYLDNYKKIYKKYILKSKIKKLPVIGWYITLRNMPNIITEMRMIDVNWRTNMKIMSKNIDKNIDAVNQKADAINQKADAINQKIDEFMELPSIPKYLVVNGILDKTSYLEYANSILADSAPEQLVEGNYYQLLEAVFRGSEESIKKHQQYYIDYMISNTKIRNTSGKYFLDAGCGRGELLTLLQEQNIFSVGIDINKINIDSLKKKGYTVYREDILEYLNQIEDNELIGLSSFQVIEHLSNEYVSKMIDTAYKKITNGGIILLETLNPYCYSNQGFFYLDPTHITWHSPDNLKLYLEYMGFCEVKVIYSAPVQPQYASEIDMMKNYSQFAVVATVKKS